jgi:hypothetical protein
MEGVNGGSHNGIHLKVDTTSVPHGRGPPAKLYQTPTASAGRKRPARRITPPMGLFRSCWQSTGRADRNRSHYGVREDLFGDPNIRQLEPDRELASVDSRCSDRLAEQVTPRLPRHGILINMAQAYLKIRGCFNMDSD